MTGAARLIALCAVPAAWWLGSTQVAHGALRAPAARPPDLGFGHHLARRTGGLDGLVNPFGLHSPPLAALVTRGSEPDVWLTAG
jgi:hypothetical protein